MWRGGPHREPHSELGTGAQHPNRECIDAQKPAGLGHPDLLRNDKRYGHQDEGNWSAPSISIRQARLDLGLLSLGFDLVLGGCKWPQSRSRKTATYFGIPETPRATAW